MRVKCRKLGGLQIKIAGVISYRNNVREGWTMGFPLWGRGRAFAVAKVPAGRCPCGSAGRIATGNPPPQQPPVVVCSNPATLMHKKAPHLYEVRGFFVQGSFKGVELTGTLPSFFAALKTKILIYQCFYFAKTAKNAILGSLPLRSAYNSDKLHFNASFILFVT